MFSILKKACNLWIIIVTLNLSGLARSQTRCGKLNLTYICTSNGIDARIILTPSEDMKSFIIVDKNYRWFHKCCNQTAYELTIRTPDSPKYSQRDTELIIRNVTKPDFGTVFLDCWNLKIVTSVEQEVYINVTDSTCNVSVTSTMAAPTTVLKPSMAESQKKGEVLTSSVVAVIAICTTIVVLVISGTIVVVMRQKKKVNLAAQLLVSHDAGSIGDVGDLRRESGYGGSVYNEIDLDMGYASINHKGFESSKLMLLSLDQSPSLPRRPSVMPPITDSHANSDYSTLKEEGQGRDTLNNANRKKPKTDKGDAKIDPNENKSNERLSKDVKANKHFPEYAKVRKVKKSNTKLKQESTLDEKSKVAHFNVVFPYINCEELFQKSQHDGEICSMSNNEVKYCNLVSRNRRSKTRSSRKELQYAVLDHSVSELGVSSKDLDLSLVKACQYASIDFEKKAFVAPLRRAPSSWYKRHIKDKEKKNVNGI